MISTELYEREALAVGQANSLSKLITYIEPNAKVLDVGCATGRLGEYLQLHTQCRVDAIEANADSAALARTYYDRLYEMDIESFDSLAVLDKDYDVIVLADVLEHLRQPELLLSALKKHLKPTGKCLISVPNVGHAAVILQLLQQGFHYLDHGLLDKTHVHFFSHHNLPIFFRTVDMSWELLDRVIVGVQGTELSNLLMDGLPPDAMRLLAALPESNTYQFLIAAYPIEHASVSTFEPNYMDRGIFINTSVFYLLQDQVGYSNTQVMNQISYLTPKLNVEHKFTLPTGCQSIRLDPADIPGIMCVKRCALFDVSGICLWSLNRSSVVLQASETCQLIWSEELSGYLVHMTDSDPWFELPVESDLLAMSVTLLFEASWVESHDYWLLKETWVDKYQSIAHYPAAYIALQNEHSSLQHEYSSLQHEHDALVKVSNSWFGLIKLLKRKLFSLF